MGVRVHHRCLILMQKNAKFFWGGGTAPSPSGDGNTPSPHPNPSILTPPILKFCLRYLKSGLGVTQGR